MKQINYKNHKIEVFKENSEHPYSHNEYLIYIDDKFYSIMYDRYHTSNEALDHAKTFIDKTYI